MTTSPSNIPAQAVEAAEEAVIDAMIKYGPDGHIDGYQEIARAALEAAAPHMLAEVTTLVAALTDPEDCHFDHHGGCQAHGYLDLKIGEMCPQLEAKAWVFNHRPTSAD